MKPLFLDTETTGFANKREGLDHHSQPYLIQLGLRLDDEGKKVRAQVNLLLDHKDITIPAESSNVHGLFVSTVEDFGISPISAISTFHNLVEKADVIVAHNMAFDLKIIQIAYARLGKITTFTEKIQTKPIFCTMEATTEICKIPSPRGNGYKWPKLDEAYRTLVDPNGFDGAHDAMNDVNACRKVFYALKNEN